MAAGKAASRTVFWVFIVIFLSSLSYCFKYISETFSRSVEMSKMSASARNVFIEDFYYKGRSSYEYAKWADSLLPDGYLLNIYDKDDYMYYHSHFNYYLYPRYIPIKENIELESNYGDNSFLGRLPYGNIVLAISASPSLKITRHNGLLVADIKGRRYTAVAKYKDNNYLLVTDRFIRTDVLRSPATWSAVFSEFSRLYPGRALMTLRGK